jgi:hypothetical protein
VKNWWPNTTVLGNNNAQAEAARKLRRGKHFLSWVGIGTMQSSTHLTKACNGQGSAVTFCAKTRTKGAIETLRVKAGVSF